MTDSSTRTEGQQLLGADGAKLLGDVIKLMQQIGQGEMDAAPARAGVSFMGDLFGLPATQMNRIIDATSKDGNAWSYLIGVKGEK